MNSIKRVRATLKLAIVLIGILAAGWSTMSAAQTSRTRERSHPDLGHDVLVFAPSMPSAEIQAQIDKVYAIQQHSEFGTARYALLFLPGEYHVDIPVGFYTEVIGLGATPDAVHIVGNVHSDASLPHNNADLCTFWRAVEGFAVTPPGGTMQWAVSQAVPFRRMHVMGSLVLKQKGGWASGGWMSDSVIDGNVGSGSQQQWISRKSEWGSWTGSNWNMVFVGIQHPPPGRVAAAALHEGGAHARRSREAISRGGFERELVCPCAGASDRQHGDHLARRCNSGPEHTAEPVLYSSAGQRHCEDDECRVSQGQRLAAGARDLRSLRTDQGHARKHNRHGAGIRDSSGP